MTNSISFAGMGSGIDFDSLRQDLMLVERQSLTRITDKQSLLKQKRDAFKDIDSRMDSLKTTLSSLLDYTSTNIFNKISATSSNTSVLTATASTSAEAGTYDVRVKNLAQAESVISATGASADSFTAGYSGTDLNTIIESNITQLGSLHRRDNSAAFTNEDIGQLSIDDGVTGPVSIDLGATLTSSNTVQDAMNELNNQLSIAGSAVTVSLNASNNGLLFTSGTGNISIADGVDGKQTATKLGAATAGLVASPIDGGDLDPSIQLDSNLSALNGGAGVSDFISGITLKLGTSSQNINLSTATKVSDVINSINTSGLSVTSSIDSGGKGFRIDAGTSNLSLAIEENGGTTASDLGLFGDSHVLQIKRASDSSYFRVFLNGGYDSNGADLSLNDIRDSINAVSGKTFSSSVVDSRLLIQSNDVGTANALQLKDNALSGGIFEQLGILINDASDDTTISNDFANNNELGGYLQTGSDAVFSINGITITRSQNTGITDALSGVTLNLIAPSSSTGSNFPTDYASTTLTIKKDSNSMANSIESFVNQYNSAIDLISSDININPEGADGILATESLARSLRDNLVNGVTALNPDLGYTYRSLFELKDSEGNYAFQMSDSGNGKIELNKTALTNILDEDADSVAKVFRYDSNSDGNIDGGIAYSLNKYVASYADSPSGVLQQQMDSYQSEIDNLDDELIYQQEKLDAKDAALKKQFATADQLVSSLQSQSNYISSQMLQLSKN